VDAGKKGQHKKKAHPQKSKEERMEQLVDGALEDEDMQEATRDSLGQ